MLRLEKEIALGHYFEFHVANFLLSQIILIRE